MIDDTIPEIQRSSLMGSVLTMKILGIDNVLEFEFIDQPERQHLIQALRRLYLLGALDENGKLTSVGQALHKIPISPYLAKSLYESISNFDCFDSMLTLCSMLSAEDIWLNIRNTETKLKAEKTWRSQFYHSSGDHATLINVYQQFEKSRFSKSWCSDHYLNYRSLSNANNIRGQLKGIVQNFSALDKSKLKEIKSDEIPVKSILQCLSTSYFLNVAKRHPSKSHFYHYGTTSSALVPSDSSHMQSELLALYIHPTSSLAYKLDPSRSHHSNIEWVIYHEMVYTSQAMIKTVSKVLFEWPKPYIDRLLTMDDNKLSGIEVKRKPESTEPEKTPEANTVKTPEVEENNEELLAQNRLTKAEEAKLRFLQRKKMKRK
jgi:HrpA-like RNA helicase